MPSLKTALNILSGDAATTGTAPIKDPRYGPMLPGPAYDAYASLRDYHGAVESLLHSMEGFEITKPQALERIALLQDSPHTATGSMLAYLAELREALESPATSVDLTAAARVSHTLLCIRSQLSVLDFGMSALATRVPRPVDPNAPQRPEGQRLGSGLAAAR